VTTPIIELIHVSKAFHINGMSIQAVEDVSLQVNAGEFVAIIGPSGCGKSTLFNMMVGLIEPDKGEILLEGGQSGDRTGRVGFMPQRDLLLPWRSVIDNAIIPLELRGVPHALALERAREMLPLFDLEDFADLYPSALSGGMRQRAALLRTILIERNTLLLDEPFGALDALTRRELQDWLLSLWHQLSHTVIFITHDVEEAIYLSDRVIVLSERPGRVIKSLEVPLPRPRRKSMIGLPEFGRQITELLEALGIEI
jgi:ABC-type nitrate/sulfonate/bicarbonate transport system ATPase subunit